MSGLKRGFWWLEALAPFAWILLIPIVTGLMQSALLENLVDQGKCTVAVGALQEEYECPRQDAWPTLLPGLLNLMAFAPVLSERREVRWAALVAGTLGAGRLAVPLLIYTVNGAHVRIDGTEGFWTGEGASVSLDLWWLSLFSAFALFAVCFLAASSSSSWSSRTGRQDR